MEKGGRLKAIGSRFKTKSSIKNDIRNATIFATSINVVFWIAGLFIGQGDRKPFNKYWEDGTYE